MNIVKLGDAIICGREKRKKRLWELLEKFLETWIAFPQNYLEHKILLNYRKLFILFSPPLLNHILKSYFFQTKLKQNLIKLVLFRHNIIGHVNTGRTYKNFCCLFNWKYVSSHLVPGVCLQFTHPMKNKLEFAKPPVQHAFM